MDLRVSKTFSDLGVLVDGNREKVSMDPQQVLPHLNFGRVDAETDDRLASCFIGTELLRQVLLPQHSLLIGGKGSGKSAMFRLMCEDFQKIKPLLPRNYHDIYCIPAHGLQSEEYLADGELRDLNPHTVDDFRYFWLLYLGLKTASTLVQDQKMQDLVDKSKNDGLKATLATLTRVMGELGLLHEMSTPAKLKQRIESWVKPIHHTEGIAPHDVGKALAVSFRQKTGLSIITLLDLIDSLLQDTNCLTWVMLDKLDLLFIGDVDKLKTAITGLVQLIVEYSSRFKNIHFKLFLRTDIYRQLHIVNKSHLVSYTSDMKWTPALMLKLLVSRAVSNPTVQSYCEGMLGEKVDVSSVIIGSDEYAEKVFYTIFDPFVGNGGYKDKGRPNTHEWILKRLIDGLGTRFPREIIHLGNLAVAKQRELNRSEGRHAAEKLLSSRAIKEAFNAVSAYRCDTYLYSEFPHLAKHIDVFRGSDSSTFHREELYMLFEPLSPKGDDAIRAVHDAGLLVPIGRNVDSSRKFKIPLLYRIGLGISDRRPKQRSVQEKKSSPPSMIDVNKMN